MKPDRNLSILRDQVAALRAVPCRLEHERVLIGEEGIRRNRESAGNDPGVVRVGLCPKTVRDSQLSCAHTCARNHLDRAIAASRREGVLSAEEAAQLHKDLERISLAIHATDWQKNQAEVRYALLLEQGAQAESEGELTLLGSLVAQHTELTTELAQLQGFLLERLEQGAT
jgi:hypothetical protein